MPKKLNHSGRLLHNIQKETVTMIKKGYLIVVMVSVDDYKLFEMLKAKLCSERAKGAEQEGFIGEEESNKILENHLNV